MKTTIKVFETESDLLNTDENDQFRQLLFDAIEDAYPSAWVVVGPALTSSCEVSSGHCDDDLRIQGEVLDIKIQVWEEGAFYDKET